VNYLFLIKRLEPWISGRRRKLKHYLRAANGNSINYDPGTLVKGLTPCIQSVLTASAPGMLLSASMTFLLIGFGVYLGFLWTKELVSETDTDDSRNVFIIYLLGLSFWFILYTMTDTPSARKAPDTAHGTMGDNLENLRYRLPCSKQKFEQNTDSDSGGDDYDLGEALMRLGLGRTRQEQDGKEDENEGKEGTGYDGKMAVKSDENSISKQKSPSKRVQQDQLTLLRQIKKNMIHYAKQTKNHLDELKGIAILGHHGGYLDDSLRQTLLIHAARYGHKWLLLSLLQGSGQEQIDVPDAMDRTPLMWASETGNLQLVTELLYRHANMDLKDKYGLSALDMAGRGGHSNVVKLLAAAISKDSRDTIKHAG
jgi:hypothetical protein